MSNELKYIEIMDFIKGSIHNGDFNKGVRLPSIREMSQKFKCSNGTVIKAYGKLVNEHYLYVVPQSGYYVIGDSDTMKNQSYEEFDFKASTPELEHIPYQNFEHSIIKSIEKYRTLLFSYGSPEGLESLRSTIADYITSRGVYTKKEDVFITNGSQQALYLLLHMDHGVDEECIVFEEPTFSGFLRILEGTNFKKIGVYRDKDAIDLKSLEYVFRTENVRYFYTIPNYHNPLGSSLSVNEKKEILRLAEKYNVMIIEDDYLGTLNLESKNAPLHYYDVDNKVIYVTSFSKSFVPGIRIGTAILPKTLHEAFTNEKFCCDISTSLITQGGLEYHISSGMYKQNITMFNSSLHEKLDIARKFKPYFENYGIEMNIPDIGIFIWLKLPPEYNASKFTDKLENSNILVDHFKDFYLYQEIKENALRLCISSLSCEKINRGLFKIIDCLNFTI